MAMVKLFMGDAVGDGLDNAMEAVSTVGNLLGIAAIVIEVLAIVFRLFRARAKAQEREMRRLRQHYNGVSKAYAKGGGSKGALAGGPAADALDLEYDEDLLGQALDKYNRNKKHGSNSKGGKGVNNSTANQAFQLHVDFGEDLDLFLLDVEEEAMKIDDLEIEMGDVVAERQPYVVVEALGDPTVDDDEELPIRHKKSIGGKRSLTSPAAALSNRSANNSRQIDATADIPSLPLSPELAGERMGEADIGSAEFILDDDYNDDNISDLPHNITTTLTTLNVNSASKPSSVSAASSPNRKTSNIPAQRRKTLTTAASHSSSPPMGRSGSSVGRKKANKSIANDNDLTDDDEL